MKGILNSRHKIEDKRPWMSRVILRSVATKDLVARIGYKVLLDFQDDRQSVILRPKAEESPRLRCVG